MGRASKSTKRNSRNCEHEKKKAAIPVHSDVSHHLPNLNGIFNVREEMRTSEKLGMRVAMVYSRALTIF